MKNDFKFLDPGKLIDNNLELILIEKIPANEKKDYVPMYVFKMRNVQSEEEMGYINLRIGNNEKIKYGGNIGYGVHEKHRGNRYAARSVKLLSSLAKKHGINPFWITCNPENTASRRTCELAGGKLIEIADLPKHDDQYKRGERRKCRYRFDV